MTSDQVAVFNKVVPGELIYKLLKDGSVGTEIATSSGENVKFDVFP